MKINFDIKNKLVSRKCYLRYETQLEQPSISECNEYARMEKVSLNSKIDVKTAKN